VYYSSFSSRNFTIINGAFIDARRYAQAYCGDSGVVKCALYISQQVALGVNALLNVIEIVASAALASLGMFFCSLTRWRSTILVKHVVALTGSLGDSLTTAVFYINNMRNAAQVGPKTHTENAVFESLRLCTSLALLRYGLVQSPGLSVTGPLDIRNVLLEMVDNNLIGSIRYRLKIILDNIHKERHVNILNEINPTDHYLAIQMEIPQRIARINQQLEGFSSEQYIQEATDEQLLDLFVVCSFYSISAAGILIGNNTGAAPQGVDAYRQHLQNVFAVSLPEVYNDPSLVACLADKNDSNPDQVQSGKESISSLSADCIIPLLHYSQLKELQQDIRCPENLDGISQHRRRNLNYAKAQLERLSDQELTLLKKRLLGLELTSEHTQGLPDEGIQAIQDLHRQIGALAAPLVQGGLVNHGWPRVNIFNQVLAQFADNVT
jgi:hypothetical protein